MSAALLGTQWTTAKTQAQRPWIMWADWQDIIAYVNMETIQITDSGGNQPAQITFVCEDRTNTIGSIIAQQQRLMFIETQANANAGRIVFHGFIKDIRPQLQGTYARWTVTAVDTSEFLDWSLPIEDFPRPAESDAARISAILGNFSTWSSMPCGGFIQVLNAAMSAGDVSHGSVRSAIEDTLSRNGTTASGYYVDKLGYLHTFQTADGGAAPFAITDTNPNLSTTIPAQLAIIDYDGTGDADLAYVTGGTAAGSGPVSGTNAPRFPARYAPVDAPDAIDAATRIGAGLTELGKRQARISIQATVKGFDGWEKGQALSVTSTALGWSGKTFIITGVDVQFMNGTGTRQYVLTAATIPGYRRRATSILRPKAVPPPRLPGSGLTGRVGSPRKGAG